MSLGPGYYVWRDKRIAFKSPRVRPSPDGHFHVCENAHWGDTSGNLVVTCFLVPPES
ncbi:hypothetical protein [Salaquimonas pukyongi]|uniref:hypothetical protein n=1 Tax=Salaquimonas pukyongi TaxID=2712698 RepID=UPI0012EB773E|nr:hypothetical protein [Salaquimonas pukyongi]